MDGPAKVGLVGRGGGPQAARVGGAAARYAAPAAENRACGDGTIPAGHRRGRSTAQWEEPYHCLRVAG